MTSDSAAPRVLQVINSLSVRYGGPPASAVATALALQGEGFDNEFAFVFRSEEVDDTDTHRAVLASAGIPIHSFPASTFWDAGARRWGVSTAFARWFVKHATDYDIVHVHGAWTFTALWSLGVTRASGRRVFLSPHETLTDFDRAKSPLLDRGLKTVGRLVFMRAFQRVIVASRLEQVDSADADGAHTTVVPHAVRGGQSVVEGVVTTPSTRSRVVVGFLARLHPKKNLEIVIEAFQHLDQRYELHIAGDGPSDYVATLRQHAYELGLEPRIRWLGFLTGEQRRRFLESADVLAVPSAYECFGVAAVEALRVGVPVVVSPTVGIADVVSEFDCGVVVPATAEAVAAGLTALVENGDRDALARRARSAASVFSIAAHGARLRRVYGFEGPLRVARPSEPVSVRSGR